MNKPQRIGWYLLFLVVNLVQAYFTPIAQDEAYYWMYGQHLDWGFFDHPPFAAAMIWLGSSLFGGTIGVRLLTTLLLTLSLPVIWATLEKPIREKPGNFGLFLLAVAVAPIFNIYGFITTPDAPLLFFAALYLWAFKRFISSSTLTNGILLGVIMAGMAWSKYHGVLVVIFTALAHWRVLKEKYFYVAALVALVLFSPHLYWQYAHDFLTFRFHLGGRAKDAMQFHNVTEYFLNSLLILNPLLLPPFLYAFFKYRKSLLPSYRPEIFLFWGFLIFFGLSTMKGHVEPHWIAICGISMMILLVKLADTQPKLSKVFRILAWVTLPLVIGLRVVLMLPLDLPTEFHEKGAAHYQAIQSEAGSAGVIFSNSYTNAAKYTFYTGDPAWSYNNLFYRPNQYDLWETRDAYVGKEAFYVNDWTEGFFDTLQVGNKRVFYKRIPDFQLPFDLKVEVIDPPTVVSNIEKNILTIEVTNPTDHVVKLNNPVVPMAFSVIITEGRRTFYTRNFTTKIPESFAPGETKALTGWFKTNAPPGTYSLGIGVKPGKIPEVLGSDYTPVRVE